MAAGGGDHGLLLEISVETPEEFRQNIPSQAAAGSKIYFMTGYLLHCTALPTLLLLKSFRNNFLLGRIVLLDWICSYFNANLNS